MSFVRIAAAIVSVHASRYTTRECAERVCDCFFSRFFYVQEHRTCDGEWFHSHFRAALECLKKCVDDSMQGADTDQWKEGTSTHAIPDLPARPML